MWGAAVVMPAAPCFFLKNSNVSFARKRTPSARRERTEFLQSNSFK
jgi:hypothetical protein